MGNLSDDEIESRVRALGGRDPARLPEVEAGLNALVADLRRPEVRASAGRARRWWRRRPVAGAIVGVILAVGAVGVPAAAVTWLAHTGVFGGGGTETDDSEWIGVDAADAPQAVRDLYPTWMPLPDGTDRGNAERVVNSLYARSVAAAKSDDEDGHVITQATDIQRMFESYGRCAWYRTWIDAHDADDPDTLALASRTIDEATRWPATVSTDGGGVVDHLRQVAESAADGDRAAVATAYGVDVCAPFTGTIDR
jgi:hypothetical protein